MPLIKCALRAFKCVVTVISNPWLSVDGLLRDVVSIAVGALAHLINQQSPLCEGRDNGLSEVIYGSTSLESPLKP